MLIASISFFKFIFPASIYSFNWSRNPLSHVGIKYIEFSNSFRTCGVFLFPI